MRQWFTTGDLNQIYLVGTGFLYDIGYTAVLSAFESKFGVTPRTAQVAASKTDKDAGKSSPCAFTLNRWIDLDDAQAFGNGDSGGH
jgi:hypothetical protein